MNVSMHMKRAAARTHVAEKLSVHGGEVCDEAEDGLEDPELNVDALARAFVHGRDDLRDRALRDGLEANEALERAEGYGDDLWVLCRAAHEDGAEELGGLGAIWDGTSACTLQA